MRLVTNSQSAIVLASLAAALNAATGSAATYTWISSTTGGNWSTTTNWNPTGAPTTGDTANLNDATASRVVTYDSSASGALGTLSFTQSSNVTNELQIQKQVTVTNAITLGASSGTSRIYILPNTAATLTPIFSGGITVNAGGALSLGAYNPAASATVYTAYLNGNVTVSGGLLELATVSKQGTMTASTSTSNVLNNALTMTSGTIRFQNNTYTDRRLQVTGTMNVSGGSVTAEGTGANFYLSGSTNIFNPTTFDGTGKINMVLQGIVDQSFSTSVNLGTLVARGYGTKTLTTSSGTIGQLQVIDGGGSAGQTTTLKLGSNVTGTSNVVPTSFGNTLESGRIDLGLDADRYTLAFLNAGGMTLLPSTQASVTNTVWNLSGTAGTIKATMFNFNSGTTTVNIAAGLTLTSTGGNSASNVLTGAGTINSTSIFRYAGTAAAATPATLVSTRSIGDIEVTSGALRVTGLSGAQNLRVAGGILDLNVASQAFASITLSSGTLTSGTATTSGAITVQDGIVSAVLGGAGGLTKTGIGTVTLSAANTYLGATTVSSGGLVINGSLANAGGLSVAAGAWLSGTGSISNLSTVSGSLIPGGGAAVMQFGSLTLASSAATLIDIAGASRGSSYDGIDVLTSSGLTYGGTLAFSFTTLLPDSTILDIFDFTGSSGSFATITSTGSYAGTWSSLGSGTWQSTQGGQTLTFSESTGDLIIVPEPVVGLATIGLACLVFTPRSWRRCGATRQGG